MHIRTPYCLILFVLFSCSDDPAPSTSDVSADSSGSSDAAVDSNDIESGDAPAEDAVADVDAGREPPSPYDFEPIPHTEADPDVPPSGHDDVLSGLDQGEVRAGQITGTNTTFGGQETDCRPGDFKLYNHRVQFCIANTVSITSMIYSGGHLIDADFVGESNDRFFILAPHSHMRLAAADEVLVLADGRDGVAVVASRGGEQSLKIIDDYVGNLMPPRGVSFVTEYRLRPDVDYLEIITWVKAVDGNQAIVGGDVVFAGDTTTPFFPGLGREIPGLNMRFDFLVATAEGRSYSLYAADGLSNFFISVGELIDFPLFPVQVVKGRIPHDWEGNFRRYFILGDGGTDTIRAAISQIEGEEPPTGSLRIVVTEGGQPAEGVSLIIRDGSDTPSDLIVTDDTGVAEIALPADTYTVDVESWPAGSPATTVVTVQDTGATEATIEVPETARAVFAVTTVLADGAEPVASPAKVELFGAEHYRIFVWGGSGEAVIAPGTYNVVFSRGEAFSATVLEEVAFPAGEETNLSAELTKVWDTTGLINGEFHQHCTRSFDSPVLEMDRLLANIVEGVDFVVPSDHDAITDLAPWIEELGAEDWIYCMPSSEVSPSFVHLNPMPMVYDPAAPSGGAFAFGRRLDDGTMVHLTFPEIVEELRQDWGAEVIQVNHPRDNSALFNSVSYDPLTGPDAVSATRFTPAFDSVEVYNGRREFCTVFRDWLSFIARGYRITGVGNSDSHGLGSEAGYPRSYLGTTAESPAEITDDDIIEALLGGDASVSGGALITFPEGPALGSTVTVEDPSSFSLPIRVQTPQWSTVDRLLVFVNAAVVYDTVIDAEVAEIIAFDDVVELSLPTDEDAYLVAVVYGEQGMPIVTPGERPFGFTNPVFLDTDGTEGWTPPGVEDASDLATLEIPWCD